jgi:hypothetical protein
MDAVCVRLRTDGIAGSAQDAQQWGASFRLDI